MGYPGPGRDRQPQQVALEGWVERSQKFSIPFSVGRASATLQSRGEAQGPGGGSGGRGGLTLTCKVQLPHKLG